MFALLVSAALAHAADADGLRWELEANTYRRWLVETDVVLPMHLWFYGDFNEQARVRTFQLRFVAACGETVREVGPIHEVTCVLEDVALSGATFASERGELQPVLDEVDRKLTDARLRLRMTERGRVTNLELRTNPVHPQVNVRIRRMNEILRLVVARGVAGMDQLLPKDGVADGPWVQYATQLVGSPSLSGTIGNAELWHTAAPFEDGQVLIRSAGRGMIVPGTKVGDPVNFFDADLSAVAVFDPADGSLTERWWRVWAVPTASSLVNQGIPGMPYVQRGALRRLRPLERVDLGDSLEWSPSAGGPTIGWHLLDEGPWDGATAVTDAAP